MAAVGHHGLERPEAKQLDVMGVIPKRSGLLWRPTPRDPRAPTMNLRDIVFPEI